MDTINAAKELTKVVKQVTKVQAILAKLEECKAELLRELGGS